MADVFIPKWKEGNGSSFMKNLEKYLKYEVDLEQHEAAMAVMHWLAKKTARWVLPGQTD
jgi:hypothetical protein